mgnify:FL=1
MDKKKLLKRLQEIENEVEELFGYAPETLVMDYAIDVPYRTIHNLIKDIKKENLITKRKEQQFLK